MKLCLNMIVKNEAHIITKTFDNLLKTFKLDYYVICDTGSTDDTVNVITTYFNQRDIKGEVLHHTWKNFGYNRTLALQAAYSKSDYLLIFDADDSIVGDLSSCLPKKLTADKYQLLFGPGISYTRPLLINNKKHWKFVGVLHEYLTSENLNKKDIDVIIQGSYYINSGRAGARSKNANKYADDAETLRVAILEEKDEGLRNRYCFYCAQSYKDSGNTLEAIEWYSKCITLKNSWAQEKWVSCNELGKLFLSKGDISEALNYFLRTTSYDPERIEGVVTAVSILFQQKNYYFIEALFKCHQGYQKNPTNKLFVNVELCQQNIFEGYYACSLLNIHRQNEGFSIITKLLQQKCNPSIIQIMFNECGNHIKSLQDTQFSEIIFNKMSELLETLPFSDTNIKTWDALFEIERKRITKYCPLAQNIKNNKKKNIILTFTTCKRFNLFKQTINSILNFWTDLDRIDYWFCVDDNSSDEDRKNMKLCYPWIEFYFKDISEKGHRTSMNIIYSKITGADIASQDLLQNPIPNQEKVQEKALKHGSKKDYKYWIHMEDDFVFYKKMNYIDQGIKGFSAFPGQNVKQVLFNKNYAETIDEHKCISSAIISSTGEYLLHNHSTTTIGLSHDYWLGYSLRPSIIEIAAIKSLGNYNSPNTFFERDYSTKWFAAGYKCAFLNKITSRHIGRLTTELNRQKIDAMSASAIASSSSSSSASSSASAIVTANAYDLNSESQFRKGISISTLAIDKNIKVINLVRRKDRKDKISSMLSECILNDYTIIKGVDLKDEITFSSTFLSNLFYGNDFNDRRGVIGCALSHFFLWNQLINDTQVNFYLILEDDVTINKDAKNIFNAAINNISNTEPDFLFLGWLSSLTQLKTDCNNINAVSQIVPLELNKYLGGFHSYIITKSGAEKMLDYIKIKGIKHGIDYLIKLCPNLKCYTFFPMLTSVDWTLGKVCQDTDIQQSFSKIKLNPPTSTHVQSLNKNLKNKFKFIPCKDMIDNDLYFYKTDNIEDALLKALLDPRCKGFNTLGFFKGLIIESELKTSSYFSTEDGIYIKL